MLREHCTRRARGTLITGPHDRHIQGAGRVAAGTVYQLACRAEPHVVRAALGLGLLVSGALPLGQCQWAKAAFHPKPLFGEHWRADRPACSLLTFDQLAAAHWGPALRRSALWPIKFGAFAQRAAVES